MQCCQYNEAVRISSESTLTLETTSEALQILSVGPREESRCWTLTLETVERQMLPEFWAN